MNALMPRPAFQVLVMPEESRLGREQIETAYALKQITDAIHLLEDRYDEGRSGIFTAGPGAMSAPAGLA